ncbi:MULTISPECIES: MaoC family dehydratase [unclassified Dietzia]|uniref:MaoC family dehydratase n=1 Tax=unclassified Dietzia TaxID=2617939 RepID=UPI000D21BFB6|nr:MULTISPECIES: MaoC family dehydratase [unclassified Dietzia]AVZ39372.1 acyl dehydratase [Dietzia sp. JS16-p6b]QGW24633.1 Acyl dehydratase [Dietzia sp. DQ12-45-1b]
MTAEQYDTFDTPLHDRYLEDYREGRIYRFGEESVDAEEIVEFARRYDPQSIHTDPEAAADGPFGGLIASGWQTAALMMRLFADNYLTAVASLASPGIDELRWVRPLRPGDTLTLICETTGVRPSRSKPDRGVLTTDVTLVNQDGDPVLTATALNMVARR